MKNMDENGKVYVFFFGILIIGIHDYGIGFSLINHPAIGVPPSMEKKTAIYSGHEYLPHTVAGI